MSAQSLGPNQRAWIADLRSGEFTQGVGVLHRVNGHRCCLGVACHTVGLMPSGSNQRFYCYEGSCGGAPEVVVAALALRANLGELKQPLYGHPTLTSANDHGVPFAEIADFCEAHPEAVFTEAR